VLYNSVGILIFLARMDLARDATSLTISTLKSHVKDFYGYILRWIVLQLDKLPIRQCWLHTQKIVKSADVTNG
jgi:hypothetical protein